MWAVPRRRQRPDRCQSKRAEKRRAAPQGFEGNAAARVDTYTPLELEADAELRSKRRSARRDFVQDAVARRIAGRGDGGQGITHCRNRNAGLRSMAV